MYRPLIYAGSLYLLSVLSACSAPQPPAAQLQYFSQSSEQHVLTEPSQQVVLLNTQTRILDEVQNRPILAQSNQLMFDGQHSFVPGQILMGRSLEGQGFLRRVLKSQFNGTQTLVQTEQAYLTEAFDELDVSGAEPLERIKPIELDRRTFKIGFVTLDSSLKAQPNFSDSRLKISNGKALFVRLAPELTLNWEVTGKMLFSALEAQLQPDLTLKPIGSVNFKRFIIPTHIGPVPVNFFIQPGAALSWGHQGSGSLQLGAKLNGRVKTGIELNATLNDAPDIETFFDYGYDGTFTEPRIDFNGKVRTRLHIPRIRVESEIVEMAGPYIEAESFIDGDLTAQMTVIGQQKKVVGTAEAHLGLGLKAGLPATHLFGKQITKELNKTLLNRRVKELYNKPVEYILPIK